jgi:cell division protein FtsW (lipid II flippase)
MDKTFRPRSNYAWAVVSLLLIVLFVANSIFVGEDAGQSLLELGLSAVLAFGTYLAWIRPKLVIGQDAVLVVNPLKTVSIPYKEIIDFETKWALSIVHAKGRTTAWVAPASGKRRWIADQTFRWYGSGVPLSENRGIETGAMSASLDSYSGQAAYLIREQMKRSH